MLPRAWLGRGLLAWSLRPVAALYGVLVALRRGLFQAGLLRSTHPGVPVVVVGNLVAGGAGKTPVVMAVVQHLHLRMARQQQSARLRAPSPDHHRHLAAPGDQQRFVPRKTGVGIVGPDFVAGRVAVAAVAPRDHAGSQATGLQVLHQRDHHRCLPRATRHHIAHHHHWHRQAFDGPQPEPIQIAMNGRQRAIEPGQRPQAPGQRAAPQPGPLQEH